jgi:hypothetical protein
VAGGETAFWAERVRSLGAPWFRGAIFPSEMVAFLAACDRAGIDAIVESGRQDGYSTAVLGDYAAVRGVPAVSIDLPSTPERGQRTRARLAGAPVELVDGNALLLLGEVVPAGARRVALLVDGPKDEVANRLLLAASARLPVALIGFHGHTIEEEERLEHARERREWFPQLEMGDLRRGAASAEVRALLTWEEELVRGLDLAPRRLDRSNLALIEVRRRRSWPSLATYGRGRGLLELMAYASARLTPRRGGLPTPPLVLAIRWRRRGSGRRKSEGRPAESGPWRRSSA